MTHRLRSFALRVLTALLATMGVLAAAGVARATCYGPCGPPTVGSQPTHLPSVLQDAVRNGPTQAVRGRASHAGATLEAMGSTAASDPPAVAAAPPEVLFVLTVQGEGGKTTTVTHHDDGKQTTVETDPEGNVLSSRTRTAPAAGS